MPAPMVTRRLLLQTALGAGALRIAGLPGLALAAAPTENRLVLVVLRGAMDGLFAVPPWNDPDYADARGAMAVARPNSDGGALDLDGFFGLHPALKPIYPLWQREEMAVAHAVAIPERTRSHFDAQDVLENGVAKAHAAPDGWLNRALALIPSDGRRMGLAVGPAVPAVMRGRTPVASWAPAKLPEAGAAFLDQVAILYDADPVLGPAFAAGRQSEAMSARALGGENEMAAGNLRAPNQFKVLAEAGGRLLAAPDGARVAVIDMGGWDTHFAQVNRLNRNLTLFAEGIAALKNALGPAWSRTVVVAATEFGRTVHANGSGGTDHGTASAAFLFGGALAGKRVLGRWPGLSRTALYQDRDLAPTIDMRALFKTVLRDHLAMAPAALDATVFPGSAAAPPLPDRLTRA